MADRAFTKSSEADQQALPPERESRALWPWLLLLLVAAGVIVWLMLWRAEGDAESAEEQTSSAIGAKLATFQLEPLTGKATAVSASDLTGKVTLVNFWGPWCGPCVIEFPYLVELVEHFRNEPEFQFFSVASNQDPWDDRGLAEATELFLKQQRATFPTYHDPQAQTTRALARAIAPEGFGFPTTVLIGRDGTIRGLWIGFAPGDEKKVREAVETALQPEEDAGRSERNGP